MSDLDVVDFVLVEDHQGVGLIGQLPGAIPYQVSPVLNTETETGNIRIVVNGNKEQHLNLPHYILVGIIVFCSYSYCVIKKYVGFQNPDK